VFSVNCLSILTPRYVKSSCSDSCCGGDVSWFELVMYHPLCFFFRSLVCAAVSLNATILVFDILMTAI